MDAEPAVIDSPSFPGKRQALVLCAAQLAAFGAIVVFQSLDGSSRARVEEIVQIPISSDPSPAPVHSGLSAPDPGDNP